MEITRDKINSLFSLQTITILFSLLLRDYELYLRITE